MSIHRSHVSKVIAVAFVGFALLGAPAWTEEPEPTTIRGEVEAVTYDEDGTVIEVAVQDEDWGTVLVGTEGKGAELLQLVGAVVSATGTLRELEEDGEYAYAIEITSYTIEAPAEPETEPEDDSSDDPEE